MKPEEKKDEQGNGKPEEDILHQVSQLIPGLGALVRGMEQSEVFRERIREVNQELERRLQGAPSGGERRSIIPRTSVSPLRRTVRHREDWTSPPPQKEIMADVFDEGDSLRVVAEIPGVSQSDIQVEVREETLRLMIHSLVREIKLPVPVDRKPQTELKNNVLQIILKKRRSD
ncbi:MAG: Hsp20/alpha crystallin family protein [Atribacterota bacterium]